MRRALARGHRLKRGAERSLFLLPAIVLLMIFIAYPIGATIVLSFVPRDQGADSDIAAQFPTLDNYEYVLTNRETLNTGNIPKGNFPLGTLIHNGLWIAIHLPLTLFIGLALALILRDVKGSSVVKGAVFLGMVTPMIVAGVILRYIYETNVGFVPAFFKLIGVDSLSHNWLTFPQTALFGLIFGSVWLWTGFSLIVYSAGLTTIPREYFEAAKIDGASAFRTFTRITFPLLRPITLVVVTMTILWELKIFDIVYAAVSITGGPGGAADVMAVQMFRYAFQASEFERAAVVASLLTMLTLLATVWLVRRLVRR
jgi:multiple sugar transport system permease protein